MVPVVAGSSPSATPFRCASGPGAAASGLPIATLRAMAEDSAAREPVVLFGEELLQAPPLPELLADAQTQACRAA